MIGIRNEWLLAAAIGAVLALAPALSQAQSTSSADDKSMSGGNCVPGLQADYADFDIRASYIQNRSPGYRWVACSMTTDSEDVWDTSEVGGGTDNGDGRGSVYVRYGSTSGSTQCTWQVIDSTGAVIETSSDSVAGVAGANYSLSSAFMLQGSGESTSFGVNCLIPPGARLHRINWEEYAYTDPQTTY